MGLDYRSVSVYAVSMEYQPPAPPSGTFYPDENVFVDGYGQRLGRIHAARLCEGREFCVIHRQSTHHMSEWPLLWRADRRIFERTCPHGIGHPDPDDMAYHASIGNGFESVHGCDGCCSGELHPMPSVDPCRCVYPDNCFCTPAQKALRNPVLDEVDEEGRRAFPRRRYTGDKHRDEYGFPDDFIEPEDREEGDPVNVLEHIPRDFLETLYMQAIERITYLEQTVKDADSMYTTTKLSRDHWRKIAIAIGDERDALFYAALKVNSNARLAMGEGVVVRTEDMDDLVAALGVNGA